MPDDTRPALADLIQRLTEVTGPSRELDAQIALLIGVVPEGAFRPCAAEDVGTFATGAYSFWTCERYTASLDAALTLLKSDDAWAVSASPDEASYAGLYRATVMPVLGSGDHDVTVHAPTPALALCIASLRARSQP